MSRVPTGRGPASCQPILPRATRQSRHGRPRASRGERKKTNQAPTCPTTRNHHQKTTPAQTLPRKPHNPDPACLQAIWMFRHFERRCGIDFSVPNPETSATNSGSRVPLSATLPFPTTPHHTSSGCTRRASHTPEDRWTCPLEYEIHGVLDVVPPCRSRQQQHS